MFLSKNTVRVEVVVVAVVYVLGIASVMVNLPAVRGGGGKR